MVAFEALITSPKFVELGRRDRAHAPVVTEEVAAPVAVKSSSATVYRSMFGSLVRHLDAVGTPFLEMTEDGFTAFLESKECTAAVRKRYIRMVERVFDYLMSRGLVMRNPASLAAPQLLSQPTKALPREKPTTFVSREHENEALSQVLRQMVASEDWRIVRDAAMVAILWGAGLKMYELRAMRVNWISGRHPEFEIQVPQVGVSRPHRVPLTGLHADCLAAWLSMRLKLGFQQPLLIVKSLTEGRLPYVPTVGPRGQKDPGMEHSSVYLRVKRALLQAGIDPARLGGRALRNSYAVRELADGHDADLVEERLGLRAPESMGRYRAAVKRSKRAERRPA